MYFDDMPTLRARIPGFILWLLFWPVPEIAEVAAMVKAYVDLWKRLYGLYGKEIHTLHRGRVERTVPREKLLVFNVEEGWGPLCRFLGVEVPDLPFPRL